MKKYSHDLTGSIITVAVLSAVSLPSVGGGLYIGEFGHPNQGASGAGAQALIEDASILRAKCFTQSLIFWTG